MHHSWTSLVITATVASVTHFTLIDLHKLHDVSFKAFPRRKKFHELIRLLEETDSKLLADPASPFAAHGLSWSTRQKMIKFYCTSKNTTSIPDFPEIFDHFHKNCDYFTVSEPGEKAVEYATEELDEAHPSAQKTEKEVDAKKRISLPTAQDQDKIPPLMKGVTDRHPPATSVPRLVPVVKDATMENFGRTCSEWSKGGSEVRDVHPDRLVLNNSGEGKKLSQHKAPVVRVTTVPEYFSLTPAADKKDRQPQIKTLDVNNIDFTPPAPNTPYIDEGKSEKSWASKDSRNWNGKWWHSNDNEEVTDYHREKCAKAVNEYQKAKPCHPFGGRGDTKMSFLDLKTNVGLLARLHRWTAVHIFSYLTRFALKPTLANRLLNEIGDFEETTAGYRNSVDQIWSLLAKECESFVTIEKEYEREEKLTIENTENITQFLERVIEYSRRRKEMNIPLEEVKAKLIIRKALAQKHPELKTRSSEWLDKSFNEFCNLVRDASFDVKHVVAENTPDLLNMYSENRSKRPWNYQQRPNYNYRNGQAHSSWEQQGHRGNYNEYSPFRYNMNNRDQIHNENRGHVRGTEHYRDRSVSTKRDRDERPRERSFSRNRYENERKGDRGRSHSRDRYSDGQDRRRGSNAGHNRYDQRERSTDNRYRTNSNTTRRSEPKTDNYEQDKNRLRNSEQRESKHNVNAVYNIEDDELFSLPVFIDSCQADFKPIEHEQEDLDEKWARVRNMVKQLTPEKPTASVPATVVRTIIHGSKQSKTLKALVDSGSSINLINAKGLEGLLQIGCLVQILQKPETIRWGGSSTTLTYETVTGFITLPISKPTGTNDQVTVNFSAYLVKDLSFPMIVGRETMARANLSMTYCLDNIASKTPGRLTGENKKEKITFCENCASNPGKRPQDRSQLSTLMASMCIEVVSDDEYTPAQQTAYNGNTNSNNRKRSYKLTNKTIIHEQALRNDFDKQQDSGEQTEREQLSSENEDKYLRLSETNFLKYLVDTGEDDITSDVINNSKEIPTQPPENSSLKASGTTTDWTSVESYARRFAHVKTISQNNWISIALVKNEKSDFEFLVDVSDDYIQKIKRSPMRTGQRRSKIHPKLLDWMSVRKEETKIGLELVQNFINEGKLVNIDQTECVLDSNFYLVRGSRVRPVFPNLDLNDATKPFLQTNSFQQKLMSIVTLRGRTHTRESTCDISDAFMSINTSKKLSSVLGLRVEGLGLKLQTGNEAKFLAFTKLPYGWAASPLVLETAMSFVTKQFVKSMTNLKVCTMDTWKNQHGPEFEVGSYMDDLRLAEGLYTLSTEHEIGAAEPNDQLLKPMIDFTPGYGLICKPSKVQLITVEASTKTLGVLYFEHGEKMKFAIYEKILEKSLPVEMTLTNCLGFLAQLNPSVPEILPPWTGLCKNLIQQVIGLVVAEKRKTHTTKKISKKTLKGIWHSVDNDVAALVTEFKEWLAEPENSQHFVYRGIDLSEPIEVFVDSSRYALGYMAVQKGRLLFYRQFMINRLSSQVVHINLKESAAIATALIDIVSKFREARVVPPKLIVRCDNKTALSIFLHLRVNSSVGDLTQRGLLTKLLTSTLLVLGEDFIKEQVSFQAVKGSENPADRLTRLNFAEKIIKKIKTLRPSIFEKIEASKNQKNVASGPQKEYLNFEDEEMQMTLTTNSNNNSENTTWVSCHLIELWDEVFLEHDDFTESETPTPEAEPRSAECLNLKQMINYDKEFNLIPVIVQHYYTLKHTMLAWKTKTAQRRVTPLLIFKKLLQEQTGLNFNTSKSGTKKTLDEIQTTPGGLLIREVFNLTQLIIGEQIAEYVVKAIHKKTHSGVTTLVGIISKSFHTPKLKKITKTVVQNCEACQFTRKSPHVPTAITVDDSYPQKPYDRVFVDIYGPIPKANKVDNNEIVARYYLTAVDSFSSRLEIIPIYTTGANGLSSDSRAGEGVSCKLVLGALLQAFSSNGFPTQLILDRATYFVKLMPVLETRYGIKVIILPPNSPWRRGRVERPHQELNRVMRTCVYEKRNNFMESLMLKTLELNNCPRKHGFSPNDVFLNFRPQGAGLQRSRNIQSTETETPIEHKTLSDLKHKKITETLEPYKFFWSQERSRNRRKMKPEGANPSIRIGDKVLVKRSTNSKYDTNFRGPLTVMEISKTGEIRVSDGTEHSRENVKHYHEENTDKKPLDHAANNDDNEARSPGKLTRGDLVVVEGTKLYEIIDHELARRVLIKDDFTFDYGEITSLINTKVVNLKQKLTAKEDNLKLKRTLTHALRKAAPGVLGEMKM
jgi:hypothetical protein